VQADLAAALSVVAAAGEYEAKLLLDHGVASLEELAQAETDLLTSIPGISEADAVSVKARARELAVEKQKRAAEAAALAAAAGGDGGPAGA
jgi:transcription termination factor NusA